MNWGQECPTCKVKRDCRVCKINQHPENQPGDSANYPEISEKILIIPSASDFHVHFRQGDLMNMVVPRIVEGGISLCYVMPNLKPPITSTEQALVYRDKLEKLDPNVSFLMSLYLNPDLTPEEIRKAKEAGIVGVKLYPRGVTTNSDIGTESYKVYYPVFKTMEEVGMILNLHGEIPSDIEQDICVMNAEEKFLIHLKELHADFPELKIVLEHATTKAAVEMVKSLGDTVGCTITIHHLQLTVDDWAGQFHNFCKPVAKFPHDRQALRDVILEGHPRFFLGTDSAPHPAHHKECAQSCAGVFTTPLALPYLATILDSFNALHMLKSFACENGKKFYNIKEEKCREIKLIRENWLVPNSYPFCNTQEEKSGIVIPFWAGKTLTWKIDSNLTYGFIKLYNRCNFGCSASLPKVIEAVLNVAFKSVKQFFSPNPILKMIGKER